MPEQEELRLIVTLDDQASAQLGKLRTDLSGLSESINRTGQTMGAGGQFNRKTKEAADGVRGLEQTLADGTTRLLGFGAVAGAVGGVVGVAATKMMESIGEILKGLTDLNEYAEKMTGLRNLKLTTGFNPGEIQQMTELYQRAGLSFQQAQTDAQGLAETINSLSKTFSPVREGILRMTPMNERPAMEDWLRQLRSAGSLSERLVLIQEKQAAIRRFDPERGDVRALHLAEQLRVAGLTQVEERTRRMTAEEQREMTRRASEGKDYLRTTVGVTQEFDKTLEAIKAMAVYGGPFLDAWKALGNVMHLVRSAADSALAGLRTVSTFLDAHPWLRAVIMATIPGGNLATSLKGMGKGFGEEGKPGEGAGGDSMSSRFGPFRNPAMPNISPANRPGGGFVDPNQRMPFVDALGTGPYAATKFTPDPNFLSNSPESANIEDRRSMDDNTSETERLTSEIKRLNDFLELGARPLGLLSTQMGGLRAGLGGGIGSGGGDMGGAGPGGGGAGPGGGGRRGGGDSGRGGGRYGGGMGGPSDEYGGGAPTGNLGTPSGTGALWSPTGAGAPLSSLKWPGGDAVTASPSTADQYKWPGSPIKGGEGGGEGGGGAEGLATDRAKLMSEINRDPALKERIADVLGHETHGDQKGAQGVMETMVNRALRLGHTSLWQTISKKDNKIPGSGFYGPVNRGELTGPSAADRKIAEEANRRVAGGSNITDFRDDQGTNAQGQPEVPREGSGVTRIGDAGPGRGEHFYYSSPAAVSWASKQREKFAGRGGGGSGGGGGVDSAYTPGGGGLPPIQGAGGVTHPGSGGAVPESLRQQMEYAGLVAGVSTEIAHGIEPGHARHTKDAPSADVDFRDPITGNKLDARNPEDQAKIAAYIENAAAAGATGIGMGTGQPGNYMGPHRAHIGQGNPAVWGAGGSGANTPKWVRDAYERGMKRRMTPEQVAAQIERLKANRGVTQQPTATGGAVSHLDNPFAPRGMLPSADDGGGRELDRAAGKPGGGRELDRAAGKDIGVHGTGKIEVDFKNMPDGVSGKAEGGGLFKDTSVSTQRQMAAAKSGETRSANAEMEE